MRAIQTFNQILLHRQPVDGRKQINGLAIIVSDAMGTSPLGPALFAFVNKGRDTVRLLYWDRSGFALWTKRLEKESFKWPLKAKESTLTLSPAQLSWLLDGLDILAQPPHEVLKFTDIK